MMVMMVNVDELRETVLFVIMETDNVKRMEKADPITLESAQRGGLLPVPKYPQNFSLLIAYETDSEELYRMAKIGGMEMLKWLERGRKFIKGVDGKQEAFRIPRQESNSDAQ